MTTVSDYIARLEDDESFPLRVCCLLNGTIGAEVRNMATAATPEDETAVISYADLMRNVRTAFG